MNKNNRICPCCGKPLVLIPPTEDLLPSRFGVSANDVPFYLISAPRYIPYTLHPRTFSRFNTAVLSEDLNIGANWLCNAGMSSHRPRYYGRLKIVTINRTDRMLNKSLLMTCSMYAAAFFCKNCGKKIALNFHSTSVFDNYFFVFFSAAALVSSWSRISLASYISLAVLCISLLITLASLFSAFYIKLFMSNFVITDQSDNMIMPDSQINVARKGLKSVFLHRSNVYETELDGYKFHLYLTEKEKIDLKLHICGIDGEQERLLSLIHKKMERGETVKLPLTFEGKFVGNAEVLETYSP